MGEVDAVIPEKSDSSEQASSTTTVANGELNGIRSKIEDNTMEVDTEDDSQISSENGISSSTNETESSTTEKLKKNLIANNIESNSNSNSSCSTNNDSSSNTKDNLLKGRSSSPSSTIKTVVSAVINESKTITEETTSLSSSVLDENSQNTADSIESNKENGSIDKCETEQSQIESESTTTEDSTTLENKILNKNENNTNSNDNKMEVDDDCSNSSQKSNENSEKKDSAQKSQSNKKLSDTKIDLKNDDKKDGTNQSSSSNSTDKNTVVQSEKNEESIVPIEEVYCSSVKKSSTAVNSSIIENKNKAVSEDDDAVIIPSDSESDDDSPKTNSKKSSEKTKEHKKSILKEKKEGTNKKVDDDVVEVLSDKDDCVVIEDDDKKDTTVRRTLRQRKSIAKNRDPFEDYDVTEVIDDSQPPSKRARTEPQTIGQIGQITIKDARSLTSDLSKQQNSFSYQANIGGNNKGTKEPTLVIIDTNSIMQQSKIGMSAQPPITASKTNTAPYLSVGNIPGQSAGVFPVNIRPAGLSPISSVTQPKNMSNTAVPTLTQNIVQDSSSILPNLTDDMFVLEAPSFIVPYIYEKPPSENLKEVVVKLSAEVKAAEKESKDKDKEKEKESKDEKNEEKSSSSPTEETSAMSNESKDDSKKDSRRRKKQKNPDDSWGESDESTDDDASDVETRTKVLIKEVKNNDITDIITDTEALKQSILGSGSESDKKSENYFDSPLGKFFIDIGIGLVQEYVQADLLKQQKRKRDKARGHNTAEIDKAINSLKQNLQDSRKHNEPFKFEMKRCEYCNFKSESALVMAHHYETPHMRQYMYKCNFCTFEIRPPHDILFHMEAVHNIKGRLEKAPSIHQCPNCPFEDNGKSKLARHLPVCAKKFRPEQNLLPPSDWEAPAKIPRIKPRHGLVGTATAYQAMAAQAAAQKAALAQFSQRTATPNNAANANNAFMRNRGRPQGNTGGRSPVPIMPTNTRVKQVSPGGVVLPNLHMPGGQYMQTQNSKKGGTGQPSISITPLPRQSNNQTSLTNPMPMQSTTITPTSGSKSTPTGLKPGQGPGGNKTSFVICEICDGYIKDLEQLRNHMQWMHKVKIHPKMIYNRPPLNCQKCQFRFFTDQGLERHLLGSHGLVTSSMQEAANKGKDAGRCPVCGRMYQWKLLNHVSRDHHMTLKPAHLSYKCTVCTATFGMYKQFENHVYTAHSTVAKKAMDSKKSGNSMASSSSGGSTSNQRNSLSGGVSNYSSLSSGDPLLKPLKINDEITIIPQPASKSRGSINEIESHIIGGTTSKSFSGTSYNNDIIYEISDDDDDDDDDDNNNDSNSITISFGTKKKFWSIEETQYLIDCYKKYRHFLQQKSFKRDNLWFLINQDMDKVGYKSSINQIKFKFDKLKRAYMKARKHNNKTKYKPREFHFMSDFDELFPQNNDDDDDNDNNSGKRLMMIEQVIKKAQLNITI